MRVLGIDATNIRSGGGLVHLREMLKAAQPVDFGISKVVVWAGSRTIESISPRPWLELLPKPGFDGHSLPRALWQHSALAKEAARSGCAALLFPGGCYTGRFRPFVSICQNMLPWCPNERARFGISWKRLRYHLLKCIQKQTFTKSLGVIFLTSFALQLVSVQKKLKLRKTAIISHGIESRFRAEPRPQKAYSAYSPNNPYRWLYVSSITAYKHQAEVIRAVAALRHEGAPLELNLVGPACGSALKPVRRLMVEYDPAGHFLHYLGEIPHEQLHCVYRDADGFIFASSCENQPLILMEAMASGLPIACSGRSPMPEILGEGGVFFDPENPASIASSLKSMMTQPNLRLQCGQLAFQRAKVHSWERCAGATLDFIFQVIRSL